MVLPCAWPARWWFTKVRHTFAWLRKLQLLRRLLHEARRLPQEAQTLMRKNSPTHADIMRNVNSEAIVLHNTRRGLTLDEHRSNITTVQRSLGLPVGVLKEGWSKEAEHRLFELLRKAKRTRNKVPALMDTEPAKATNTLPDDPIEDCGPAHEKNDPIKDCGAPEEKVEGKSRTSLTQLHRPRPRTQRARRRRSPFRTSRSVSARPWTKRCPRTLRTSSMSAFSRLAGIEGSNHGAEQGARASRCNC